MIPCLDSSAPSVKKNDNVRKYLLYAIGEILVVVTGILIILQINNWKQKRKVRIEIEDNRAGYFRAD